MADRIEHFTVTVPANTPQNAPRTTPLPIGLSNVLAIDIEIPPGPSGLMGWYLTMGGNQAIPRTPGSYFVADDKVYSWDVTHFGTSGQWGIVAYNTDVFDHVVNITFQVNEVSYSPTGGNMTPIGL